MLLSSALRPKPLLSRFSKLLPTFPGGRSHFSLKFWASLDPDITVHQISAESAPLNLKKKKKCFLFTINSTYSLHREHWVIQESVYVLHFITCNGHIMPLLAEFLFSICIKDNGWNLQCMIKEVKLSSYWLNFGGYLPLPLDCGRVKSRNL